MSNKTAVSPKHHSIQFGKEKIVFILSFENRKRLSITVHPDKSITAKAPLGKTVDAVLERIKKRASWIIKQKQYFERFQPLPPEKQYVSGETFLYLGRQYRLKVRKDKQETVKLIGRYLNVYTKDTGNKKRIKYLVDSWYLEHGKIIIMRHFEQCFESIKRISISYPKIRFRRMKNRWGSFGKTGTITLNTELINAPLYCIDYVIVHELCHLKYPNHGKKFFQLLTRLMPDWKQRKKRLERVII